MPKPTIIKVKLSRSSPHPDCYYVVDSITGALELSTDIKSDRRRIGVGVGETLTPLQAKALFDVPNYEISVTLAK